MSIEYKHLNKTNAHYIITSLCFGKKYIPIFKHWIKQIHKICPNSGIYIPGLPPFIDLKPGEAFWDIIRLENNLQLLNIENYPIIHCDIDVIIVKNLMPIVELGIKENYDLIFSRETWGNPLPICSGLYIMFKSSSNFMNMILEYMKTQKYNTYSDQNTLRSYINETIHTIENVNCCLDGIQYKNTIIKLLDDNITICILDMDIVTRDPIFTKTQYANHINVDNVGGSSTFIRFFYERIEDLPLTCRCGKTHLRNYDTSCRHLLERISSSSSTSLSSL